MARILFASWLALCFGFLLALIIFRPTPQELEIIVEYKEKKTQCETKYKKLIKMRPVFVPIQVNCVKNEECEEELLSCTTSLSGIRKWCDPYCAGELESCTQALQMIEEPNYLENYYLCL